MKFAISLASVSLVSGHGNMVWPRPWTDGFDTNMYAGQGNANNGAMWFADTVMLPKDQNQTNAVSNDDPMRTYYDTNIHPISPDWPDKPVDIYSRHPWRAPGTTKTYSPCGVFGGNPDGCWTDPSHTKRQDPCPDGAVADGPDAIDVYRANNFSPVPVTKWKPGQQVEVAWGFVANHGGGYSYRLCQTSDLAGKPVNNLTEECFQAGVLDFVGDKQWFQFGYNRSSRGMFGDIPAKRTAKGTYPPGSMWTRNPTPGCKPPLSARANKRGGGNQTAYPNKGGAVSCSKEAFRGGAYENITEYFGPQFEPVGGFPGKYAKHGIYTYGYGNNEGDNSGGPILYNVVDLVQIPKDLKPGFYVLSHRYDAEQTVQVWNSCADIIILPLSSPRRDQSLIPDGPAGIELPPFEPKDVVV